jgi:hypothetical protein
MEMINKSDKQFSDISSEEFRQYDFPGGETVKIVAPLALSVSDNGHRVFDASGVSHYVPMGWLHLQWKAKDGEPNFVR